MRRDDARPSISELFAQKRPLRSLEFFPPKDDAGVEALRATARRRQTHAAGNFV